MALVRTLSPIEETVKPGILDKVLILRNFKTLEKVGDK